MGIPYRIATISTLLRCFCTSFTHNTTTKNIFSHSRRDDQELGHPQVFQVEQKSAAVHRLLLQQQVQNGQIRPAVTQGVEFFVNGRSGFRADNSITVRCQLREHAYRSATSVFNINIWTHSNLSWSVFTNDTSLLYFSSGEYFIIIKCVLALF